MIHLEKSISKNKAFNFQIMFTKEYWSYFSFNVNWTTRVDHAGFHLDLGVMNFDFSFSVYDSRHWNDKENRWMRHGEPDEYESNFF